MTPRRPSGVEYYQGAAQPNESSTIVGTDSKVTLGFLIAIVVLLLPLVGTSVGMYFTLGNIQADMRRTWTVEDMAIWRARMQQDNPQMALKGLDPYDIHNQRKSSQQ